MLPRCVIVAAALLLVGCGASTKDADSPEVTPETVPSLALLGTAGRGEEASASGDGPSCEDVIDRERRRAESGDAAGEEPPVEHDDDIRATLSSGDYLNGCNVDDIAAIDVCAAIIDGRADGVTVELNPGNAGQAACVANAIRRIDFPTHHLVSVARTSFEPQ